MALICIDVNGEIIIMAQGGKKAMWLYFVSALDCLLALANMAGGKLHIYFFDREAWHRFQKRGICSSIK